MIRISSVEGASRESGVRMSNVELRNIECRRVGARPGRAFYLMGGFGRGSA